MTILTPQDAAEERSKLSRALRDSIEEQYAAGLRRAAAEHACDLAYSNAILKSTASNAEKRKAEAYHATEDLQRELLEAQVIETYLKTRVRGIETDMELLKTVAAGIRREFEEAHRAPVGAS